MLLGLTTLLGALYGALLARRRGGNGADLALYAVVCGFLGAMAGLVVLVILSRLG